MAAAPVSVANSLMLPGRFSQPRISSGFAIKKTAAANPFIEVPNQYQLLGNGAFTAGMFFRDALRNYIISVPNNVSPQNSRYDYVFIPSDLGLLNVILSGQTLQLKPQYLALNGSFTFAPHGKYMYAGQFGDRVAVWFDSNTKLTIQLDTTTLADEVLVTAYAWDGRKMQEYSSVSQGAITLNTDTDVFTANDCGYYSFDITYTSTAGASITVTQASITNYVASELIFGHHPMPGVDDNFDDTKSLRVPAYGITMRNSTAAEYLNGQATACMMSKGDDPLKYFNDAFPLDAMYQQIASLKDAQTLSFKNSFYTYLRPNEITDLDYIDLGAKDVQFGEAFPTDSYAYFSLKPEAGWLIVVVQTVAQTVSVAGTSSQFRLEYGIQFDTTNTWFMTRVPDTDPDQVVSACKLLARQPLVLQGEGKDVSPL